MIVEKRLRVGLVGTGFGTRVHLPAFELCDGIEVVAICSASRSRAADAADRFGIPHYTDDYRELVARDDIDLVDVCTPPRSHRAITLAAIDRGKHVLCEKPLALDAAEAAEMLEAAERAGVVHAVNHETRYLPVRREIRRLVADGFIGRPTFVAAAVHVGHGTNPSMEPYYYGWLAERAEGGGVLMGLLSHHIDLIRHTLGEIEAVTGRVETIIRERPVLEFEYRDGDPIGPDTPTDGTRLVDADDAAVFTARIGTALVTVSGSWSLHHPRGVSLEIYGDQGTLVLQPDGALTGARAGDSQLRDLPITFDAPAVADAHYLVPPFALLAQDLAATIAGGGAGMFATFSDGLRLQQIIDTVRAGATEGHVDGEC